MNICQNCGQPSVVESNFCRFCGTRLTAHAEPRPQHLPQNKSFEASPPRPYSWKTDEFPPQPARAPNTSTDWTKTPVASASNLPQFVPPAPLYRQPTSVPFQRHCIRCGQINFPRIDRKISTAGWIVFAILLVTVFPLFWIGFLIKEDVLMCPVCGSRLS